MGFGNRVKEHLFQGNRGGKCNFGGEQANKENVGEHGTQENKFSIFGEQASLFHTPPPPPPPP